MRFLAVLSLLGLIACTHTYPPKEDPVNLVVSSGQSIEYKLGFKHGCDSALANAGEVNYKFVKDISLYSTSNDYTNGWNAGEDSCKK